MSFLSSLHERGTKNLGLTHAVVPHKMYSLSKYRGKDARVWKNRARKRRWGRDAEGSWKSWKIPRQSRVSFRVRLAYSWRRSAVINSPENANKRDKGSVRGKEPWRETTALFCIHVHTSYSGWVFASQLPGTRSSERETGEKRTSRMDRQRKETGIRPPLYAPMFYASLRWKLLQGRFLREAIAPSFWNYVRRSRIPPRVLCNRLLLPCLDSWSSNRCRLGKILNECFYYESRTHVFVNPLRLSDLKLFDYSLSWRLSCQCSFLVNYDVHGLKYNRKKTFKQFNCTVWIVHK